MDKRIDEERKQNNNNSNNSNTGNISSSNTTSNSNNNNTKKKYFADEDKDIQKDTASVSTQKPNKNNIGLNIDPLSGEVKDVNVNMKVSGDDAKKFYDNNKQYLPSQEQVISGAKSGANSLKNSGVLDEPEKKQSMFSSLFGGGAPTTKKGI